MFFRIDFGNLTFERDSFSSFVIKLFQSSHILNMTVNFLNKKKTKTKPTSGGNGRFTGALSSPWKLPFSPMIAPHSLHPDPTISLSNILLTIIHTPSCLLQKHNDENKMFNSVFSFLYYEVSCHLTVLMNSDEPVE